MPKRSGLGKGLEAIFGGDVMDNQNLLKKPEQVSRETSEKPTVTSSRKQRSGKTQISDPAAAAKREEVGKEKIKNILKLSEIEPNRKQPRKQFPEETLRELTESIRKYGVLQPLLVQKSGDHYEIIAGERRWRAAREAGLSEVPVIIREYNRQESMEIALIENLQREDLNPIEEANAYQQLMQEFALTQEEIAEKVSKSRTAVTNSMRLLKLDSRVQNFLVQEQLSTGHARALIALEDGELQYQTALKIINQKLSVREVEKLVRLLTTEKKEKKQEEEETRELSMIYRDLEDRMKEIMGTKVLINRKDKNKGRIEIEYYSEAELERLVDLIESLSNRE